MVGVSVVMLLLVVSGSSDGRVIRRYPVANNEEEVNKDVFVPSNEWQVVKPGQAIPAGLHVRMNIATGLKEARLLEDPALSHENFVKRLREHDAERKRKLDEKTLHSNNAPLHSNNVPLHSNNVPLHSNNVEQHKNEHHAVMAVMEKQIDDSLKRIEDSLKKNGKIAKEMDNLVTNKESNGEEKTAGPKIKDGKIAGAGVGVRKVGFSGNIVCLAGVLGVGVSVLGLMYNKRRLKMMKAMSPPDKIL